jgi:hypothetical protein
VVRVVEPADGASDVRDDAMNPLVLRFEVSEACPDPLPAPAPTLRDPNGALVSLDFTRAGTELTARPLGYLVDGLFEIDPGSRTDECTSKPARVTTFRIGPGPDVRLVVFTPHDKYTSGSELESLEIFLSEPLDLDALGAIERNVTVSGLEPSDIYYMKDTASILWSWQRDDRRRPAAHHHREGHRPGPAGPGLRQRPADGHRLRAVGCAPRTTSSTGGGGRQGPAPSRPTPTPTTRTPGGGQSFAAAPARARAGGGRGRSCPAAAGEAGAAEAPALRARQARWPAMCLKSGRHGPEGAAVTETFKNYVAGQWVECRSRRTSRTATRRHRRARRQFQASDAATCTPPATRRSAPSRSGPRWPAPRRGEILFKAAESSSSGCPGSPRR